MVIIVIAHLVIFTYITARIQGLCRETNDDYYGCLTMTKVNRTSAVCLAPPGDHLVHA